jgi:hypothetical protein
MKLKHLIEIIMSFIIFGFFYKLTYKTYLYLIISKNHGFVAFVIFLGLILSAGIALFIQETAIKIFKKIKSFFK